MGCSCRPIVGALGRKMILAEFSFTATTTALAAGDVIIDGLIKRDLYDLTKGAARLVEYTVEQRHASAPTKKGINAVMYHTAPTSMTTAIADPDAVSALDFVKLAGVAKVVTADYVDYTTAAEIISVASKNIETSALPIVYNDNDTSPKDIWIKILAGETMTFGASTLVHIKLWFEIF
mgnify:FL=1